MSGKKRGPGGPPPASPARIRRKLVVQPECFEDLRYWCETDRKVALKVFDLIESALRDPFRGLGKPEPLSHLGSDIWSRRITQGDRLVYRVHHEFVDFLMARYHC